MKRILLIGIALVAVLGVVAVLLYSNDALPFSRDQSGEIETIAIQKGPLSQSIGATGRVRSNQSATLTWKISGLVGETFVETGEAVQTGDVLASIDQSSLSPLDILASSELVSAQKALEDLRESQVQQAAAQQGVDAAEDALDDALNPELAQAQALQAIAEAEKEVAESELKSAEAELERINLLIKETEIRSPISGIIGKKNFDLGEKVKPDSNMFTVFKSSKVYVRFEAGENISSEIEKGMKAVVSAGGESEEGEISIISPVINPETRTREIKIILDNKNGKFIPGGFAHIKVKTGREKERYIIPENAVIENREDGVTSVFIVRNNAAFKKEVKVLYKTDETAVLADGALEEGELVCLDPPVSLSDGREVSIIQ